MSESKKWFCPYNPCHILTNYRRFLQHIIKCGKCYPRVKLYTCVYNASHIMNNSLKHQHLLTCPDRAPINHISAVVPNENESRLLEDEFDDLNEDITEVDENETTITWESEPPWWDFGETPPDYKEKPDQKDEESLFPFLNSDLDDNESEDEYKTSTIYEDSTFGKRNIISLNEILIKRKRSDRL